MSLGFFHRHQKSLMLILLAPALLAMGISGAVMSVMTNPGEQVAGKIFGEEVNEKEFQLIRRMFNTTSQGAGEEETWRFYALLKAAEANGIDVSRKTVGKQILETMKFSMARAKAFEEVQKKKIDIRTKAGQQEFQQIVFREILSGDAKWDAEEYKKLVSQQSGLPVRSFEEQQIREAKVQRLLELLRDMGTVSPQDVWEAYQDEAHRRTLELIELPAKDYRPDLAAKKGSKGYVSAEEVKAYYESRKQDYDEPRQVNLAFLGVNFKDAEGEVDAPEREALEAFNVAEGIAPVASFAEFEDKIRDAWFAARSRERVEKIMDFVALKIEKAELDKQVPDLAAIGSAVRAEFKSEVVLQGETGMGEVEALAEEGLLEGYAAERWFRVGEADPAKKEFSTSDVLASDKGWFVLQTRAVKFARTPSYDEVKAQARQDYATGSERERKAYYEDHKSDYLLDQAWVIEAVLAKDEKFEKDHDKAREALDKALSVSSKWKKGFSIKKFETDPDVPQLDTREWERLTRDEFDENEILKKVASDLSTAPRKLMSRPFEYEGGWAAYRVVKQLPRETQDYDEVKDEVAEAVAMERAVERAELGAHELLGELRVLRGDELAKAMKEKGLTSRKTEPFKRTDTSLEGIEDAARLVGEGFSAEAEVGGGYKAVVGDAKGKRVFLVRVDAKVDAPEDTYAERYHALRRDLLTKKKMEFASEKQQRLLLKAKGIEDPLLDYAREVRDGPNGEYMLTFRQVFVPADRTIIDTWLDKAAREKLSKAQAALKAGTSWASVVSEYSEDTATSRSEGQLPEATRGELANAFGNDFVEAAFRLPRGQVSGVIKSRVGLHLVRLFAEKPGGKRVFQHLQINLDPKVRVLHVADGQKKWAEVLALAEKTSKDKLEKAMAEVAGGRSFAEVAKEIGDPRDPYGQGTELEIEFVTHLERAALGQYLNMEPPENHEHADDPTWVPDVVEVDGPKGKTYHLFACERERDASGSYDDSRFQNRVVYALSTPNKKDAEEARQELVDELKDLEAKDEDRSWTTMLTSFKKLTREYSKAPSAAKGGALGTLSLKSDVRGYGEEFLKQVSYQPDGKPVVAGYRSGVFRSAAGFHVIEIVKVEIATKDDKKRMSRVAEQLLSGSDWK